jgi:hypothetical protein
MNRQVGPYSTLITPQAGSLFHAVLQLPVCPPGQAWVHAGAGTLCAMTGAFSKPVRRFSRSR